MPIRASDFINPQFHHTKTATIDLRQVTKQFGTKQAVKGISIQVFPGEIYAFLGSNGAGKTTTIKMMTGLLLPTSGTIHMGQYDVTTHPDEAKRLIGYVPDTPIVHEFLTGQEFLWFMSDLYGLSRKEGRERTAELLALFQLEEARDRIIRDYSLGMRRKLSIAAALIHRPAILLLDEVTNGLDARAARDVKDFVLEAAAAGATIFLTTHILSLAEEMATRIGLLHQGEIVATGTFAEMAEHAGLSEGTSLEQIFLALTGDKPDVVDPEANAQVLKRRPLWGRREARKKP
jgi:ABC-2 type transport system ATP-binding protein